MKALVTGAGGFIGTHLVTSLVGKGYWVRGVDLHSPHFGESMAQEFLHVDLRDHRKVDQVLEGVDEVYHLAADMGGIGYISHYRARVAVNNTTIDLNMLRQCPTQVRRFFYASSACVYPMFLQTNSQAASLREESAVPADPEPGYGWEKLYTEQLLKYAHDEYGLPVRIARFHNIFGPLGTYDGGREKSIAALCRKVAAAQDGGKIAVWGDGQQTRSYLYVEDCVDGIYTLVQSDTSAPRNLGSNRAVNITELAEIIMKIAGKELCIEYDLSAPQGVRGRNSDNTLFETELGWKPKYSLEEGLERTYTWIKDQMR